jgi:uncharacterized peroxidase-related enzyme
MPRIAPVADSAAPPETAAILAAIKGKIGMVPNLYRTTAQNPAVLTALLGLGEALGRGRFTAGEREAIALTVAEVNTCDYCASAHTAIATSLKATPDDIAGYRAARAADPRLAGILTLARRLVETRGKVTDADLAAARTAGLTEADIVETVGMTVQNIFTNYLNHVFETEIDFPVVRTAA